MERIDKVQNLIPEKPEFVHSNQEKGEDVESLKIVNRPVVKKDAAALVTGKAVYTNDLAPSDCLIVKVVRSPYAHALIKDIQLVPRQYLESNVFLHIKIARIRDLQWLVRHIRNQVRMTV